VDCDGRLAGNVDDLELEVPEDGGPPVVTAILSGPGALGPRIGGRIGKLLAALSDRLGQRPDGRPARVPFALVKRVENHVEVSVPRTELESNHFEEWVARHIIGKIPGATRASE
jgi:hypothetical protein